MNHAAVMSRLVLRDLVLFFQDKDFCPGMTLRQQHSRCQADDARADDGDIKLLHGKLAARLRVRG